jgi:hypothetical protein
MNNAKLDNLLVFIPLGLIFSGFVLLAYHETMSDSAAFTFSAGLFMVWIMDISDPKSKDEEPRAIMSLILSIFVGTYGVCLLV